MSLGLAAAKNRAFALRLICPRYLTGCPWSGKDVGKIIRLPSGAWSIISRTYGKRYTPPRTWRPRSSGWARPRYRAPSTRSRRSSGNASRYPPGSTDQARRVSTLDELEEILPGLRCLIDASEQQVQRPKRKDMEKSHYSGKAGRHSNWIKDPNNRS